jgi:hypothetical protein
MEQSFLTIALLILIACIALNFALTVRLARQMKVLQRQSSVALGSPLPYFEGRRLADDLLVAFPPGTGPLALLFLSPKCPGCRAVLPELEKIRDAAQRSGLALWIVGMESRHNMQEMLRGSALFEHCLAVEASVRDKLNPAQGTPFYLFADDQGNALSSNFIGDADWRSFIAQMTQEDVAAA